MDIYLYILIHCYIVINIDLKKIAWNNLISVPKVISIIYNLPLHKINQSSTLH